MNKLGFFFLSRSIVTTIDFKLNVNITYKIINRLVLRLNHLFTIPPTRHGIKYYVCCVNVSSPHKPNKRTLLSYTHSHVKTTQKKVFRLIFSRVTTNRISKRFFFPHFIRQKLPTFSS